mgnify:CR=1 FL=1
MRVRLVCATWGDSAATSDVDKRQWVRALLRAVTTAVVRAVAKTMSAALKMHSCVLYSTSRRRGEVEGGDGGAAGTCASITTGGPPRRGKVECGDGSVVAEAPSLIEL